MSRHPDRLLSTEHAQTSPCRCAHGAEQADEHRRPSAADAPPRAAPDALGWRVEDQSLLWQDSGEHRRLFASADQDGTPFKEGAGLALGVAAALVVLALLTAVAADSDLLRTSRAADLLLRRLLPVLA